MDVTVTCPHCRQLVYISNKRSQLSLQIHGTLLHNGEPLTKPLTQSCYEYLKEEGKIIGCGKPFILVRKSSIQYEARVYPIESVREFTTLENVLSERDRSVTI
jgi:hypothetical protein